MGRSSFKKGVGAGKENLESSKKPDALSLRFKPLIHIFLIAALGFLVYSNTFHSSFHWDDGPQITGNPIIKHIENFTSSSRGYDFNPRRFIGYLTFAINYYFDGGSVTGYHVVNLGIHLINAFLVYFLVLLTFKTPNMRRTAPSTGPPPVLIALFSALLFVSHPLQTESVTYIVQRLASLATLFYLLSMIMYIKGRLELQSGEGPAHDDKSGRGHVFSFVLYAVCSLVFAVLAMKTKEIAFTLPIMIVLYEFIFFKSSPRKKLLFLLPVLLTLLIIPLSVLHSSKSLGDLLSDVTQQTRVQTGMSRWAYLMTEMSVIATYIRLMFFPVNQNLDYGYPHYQSLFTAHVLLSFLFLLSIFGLGVYLLHKSKLKTADRGKQGTEIKERNTMHFEKGDINDIGVSEPIPSSYSSTYAPYYRLISFGIFWFFLALSVESSVIPIVDVIFEHRVYLPSAGFFMAITTGVFVVAERLRKEKAFMAVFVLILMALSVATYERNTVWKNETSLWQDVVAKSPDKARPHSNLGYFYMKNGHPYKARRQLLAALKINPDYVEAHTSLGNVYLMLDRRDDARRELQTALKLNPNYTEAHIDLGNLYASEGSLDEAEGEYKTVLKLKPDHAEAHISLGNVYLMQGRRDDALREYRTALKLSPDDFQAHNNLGNLYFMENRLDDAIKEYKIALKLNPDAAQTRRNLDTVYRKQGRPVETAAQQHGPALKKQTQADEHIQLGNTYYKEGRLDDAVREYREFLKSNPGSAEAHNNLGNVYYKQGRLDEALTEYKAALKLKPGSAEVHNNLGKIYGRRGRLDKALEEFRAAIKLNPDFADAHNMLGNVYGLQGRLDKALEEYEAALKLNPDSANAHNNLGTIYYRQGNLDEALKEFKTAARLDPSDPGIRRNIQALRKKRGIE